MIFNAVVRMYYNPIVPNRKIDEFFSITIIHPKSKLDETLIN